MDSRSEVRQMSNVPASLMQETMMNNKEEKKKNLKAPSGNKKYKAATNMKFLRDVAVFWNEGTARSRKRRGIKHKLYLYCNSAL